jgi:hypothetical protein
MSAQSASLEEKTLTGFMKEHEKLITVIGVFGALTAFFTNMENGAVLVLFSYLIFFLLCLELMTHFPKFTEYYNMGLKTIRLFTFQVLLCFLIVILFGYVVYYQPATLVFAILISLMGVTFYSNQISIPVNRYLNSHQKTGKAVRILVNFVIFAALSLAVLLIIGIILFALSYFGIITLPPPP